MRPHLEEGSEKPEFGQGQSLSKEAGSWKHKDIFKLSGKIQERSKTEPHPKYGPDIKTSDSTPQDNLRETVSSHKETLRGEKSEQKKAWAAFMKEEDLG